MAAGKFLMLIGGLVTLASTFLLTFFQFFTGYGWGGGIIMRIPDVFSNAETFATSLGVNVILVYVIEIIFIIFLLAGILQILGITSRAAGFIGSIFALGVGVYFILIGLGVLPGEASAYLFFMIGEAIGPIPIHYQLGDFGIGVYTLVAGGFLGILGAALSKEEDYY